MNPEQREKTTVPELAKHILRDLKSSVEKARDDRFRNRFDSDEDDFSLPHLQQQICHENKVGHELQDKTFYQKFCEAIALLKRRGLLMDSVPTSLNSWLSVRLTSVGERTEFDDGILILIDDAQEIVNKVKGEVPNLDDVVEQYFLESLRTCQEGCYIASVICLGAASERAIRCLSAAVIKRNSMYQRDIENKRNMYALIEYLSGKILDILKPIEHSNNNSTYRDELKENLNGISHIYRRNRNEAGHPRSVRQDRTRDAQECYLNEFRRYVCTVFKAIDILENGKKK